MKGGEQGCIYLQDVGSGIRGTKGVKWGNDQPINDNCVLRVSQYSHMSWSWSEQVPLKHNYNYTLIPDCVALCPRRSILLVHCHENLSYYHKTYFFIYWQLSGTTVRFPKPLAVKPEKNWQRGTNYKNAEDIMIHINVTMMLNYLIFSHFFVDMWNTHRSL